MHGPTTIDERFDGLDTDVWTPAYMPAWSSLREAAATWTVAADGLHLTIPPGQGLWCAELHPEPLRVSAIQSGNRSGPVGSTDGQQSFLDGQTVREEQPTVWGFTPEYGTIEIVCRATIGARSMFSAWMVGLEDAPDRCGEICLIEVFGRTRDVDDDGRETVEAGRGIHRFRDPALREEFAAPRTALDVSIDHAYAVEWRPGSVVFRIDGGEVARVAQAPAYPMQVILGVFDFPGWPAGDGEPVPELVVRSVVGTPDRSAADACGPGLTG